MSRQVYLQSLLPARKSGVNRHTTVVVKDGTVQNINNNKRKAPEVSTSTTAAEDVSDGPSTLLNATTPNKKTKIQQEEVHISAMVEEEEEEGAAEADLSSPPPLESHSHSSSLAEPIPSPPSPVEFVAPPSPIPIPTPTVTRAATIHHAVMRVPASTAVSVRAANAVHTNVMALLDQLAPMPGVHLPAPSPIPVVPTPARNTRAVAPAPTMTRPFVFLLPVPSSSASSVTSPFRTTLLPLPTHFNFLLSVFSALDSTLSLLLSRSTHVPSWEQDLHPAVERIMKKNVSLNHLRQIMTLYPTAYALIESHGNDVERKQFRKDWRITFGQSQGESEDVEVKIGRAVSTGGALISNSIIVSRRTELEARMREYTYQAHQAWLKRTVDEWNTKKQGKERIRSRKEMEEDESTASSSRTPPSSITTLTSIDITSMSTMLSTPLPRMPCWHPLFILDDASYLTPLALHPLPDAALKSAQKEAEMKEQEKINPRSMKQLMMQKMEIPKPQGLLRTQAPGAARLINNNSGGVTANTASSTMPPAVLAAASSSASAASASSLLVGPPKLSHSSLSVLSSSVLARISTSMHMRAVSSVSSDGSATLRAELRDLHKMKALYTSILALLKLRKRVAMPLVQLITELKAIQRGEYTEDRAVRTGIEKLCDAIPAWCEIAAGASASSSSSSSSAVDTSIFKTRGTLPKQLCDPVTGRDKNISVIETLIREKEKAMKDEGKTLEEKQMEADDDDDARTVKMETSDSIVANPIVKIEPIEDAVMPIAAAASSSSAIARPSASSAHTPMSDSSSIQVKQELHDASSARLSTLRDTIQTRHLASPSKRIVPPPNVSGRAHLLAAASTSTASKPKAKQSSLAAATTTNTNASTLSRMR